MRSLFWIPVMAAGLLASHVLAHAERPAGAEAAVARIAPALEAYVRALQQREEVPGISIVIADRNRILYTKGFGIRDINRPEPVTPDTVFQIGSATKSFLATTVAMAVDAGKLAWATPLVERYPSFRLQDAWLTQQVSAEDVLSHGVGLQPYLFDDMIFLGYDAPSRLKAVAHAPLTGQFRRSAQYVNLLHPLVGQIAANAMGKPDWNTLLSDHIFKPSQMASSSATRDGLLNAANHAAPHQHIDGKLERLNLVGNYWYQDGVGSAGSINTSANDMGQWLRLQLGRGEIDGKRLVSVANMDETWRPRAMLTPTDGSALGWGVAYTPHGRMVVHEGGTASYGSVMLLLPDVGPSGLGIAVLTNHSQEGAPIAIARWFVDRVWGLPLSDRRAGFRRAATPANPGVAAKSVQLSPTTAAAYVGIYESATLGRVMVERPGAGDPVVRDGQGGDLVMRLTQIGARLRLVPVGDHAFSAEVLPEGRFRELVAEGFTPIYQVTFALGADGKARGAQAVNPQGSRHDLVYAAAR